MIDSVHYSFLPSITNQSVLIKAELSKDLVWHPRVKTIVFDHLGSAGFVTIAQKYRNTQKNTQIHKYKTIVFNHLGSAGACQHCTQLQSLVLERAKKNCHCWCCTDVAFQNTYSNVALTLHFKTHIPILADVGANIGREEKRNAYT